MNDNVYDLLTPLYNTPMNKNGIGNQILAAGEKKGKVGYMA